jgi:hypothetical protein
VPEGFWTEAVQMTVRTMLHKNCAMSVIAAVVGTTSAEIVGFARRNQLIPKHRGPARIRVPIALPLPPGSRVRVNKTFPYGDYGRMGTVWYATPVRGAWVKFDDNDKYLANWHPSYFDIVPLLPAPQTTSMSPT